MERPNTTVAAPAGLTLSFGAWLLGVALLLAGQASLTAQLFGPNPIRNLRNDQPIVSGSHPQNYYLGLLGAKAIMTHFRTSLLDHSFQALYPVTPIFDGGRLAELFLLVGGGKHHPAAYKMGFAVTCMLVPIFLLQASRSLGLGYAASLLATFFGQLVWWGPHGETAIQTGHCELYLAAIAGLTHVGWLIDFHRTASVRAWFGLCITAGVGWFLQPLLLPIALPLLLVYYHSVGVKHEFMTWHVAFWTAELFAIVANLLWLPDWIDSWWLRASLPTAAGFLEHRTIATVWNAPIWAGSTERMLAIVLMLSAGVGVVFLNQTQQRPAARLLGMGAVGALVLALLGVSWEPLGADGLAALLAPALWFACLPAAHAWVCVACWLWRKGGGGRVGLAVLVLNVLACFVLFTSSPRSLFDRCFHAEPLEIGLGAERQAIVEVLREYTSADARILWEDRARPKPASRWSALLPILTERQYIGGLDPDGFIEHSSISLLNQTLADKPIDLLQDNDLQEYCRRYNIRWIVAWSPKVIERFDRWELAAKVKPIADEQPGWLFEVKRTANFALKGQAELLHADGHYITLGNVVPKNGEVIISMHYQTGMRASPGRVQVERAAWGDNPLDFVRLKLADRITVVTLSWER